jgi:pimeloyl-ACP methyl ester carboxylesterase
MNAEYLKVPGARIYYETRGAGPVLLMIPGGPTDADLFGSIAPMLAEHYTVVTYDPRGLSRSTLEGPPSDWRADLNSDDAASLLRAVSHQPGFVFASSGGAQIGLDLAARHPEVVQALVAHEPPCTELLPDAAQKRAATEEVYNAYLKDGPNAAMQKFFALARFEASAEPPPDPESMVRLARNIEVFLRHGVRQITAYAPDIAKLRSNSGRVVVGVGMTSAGQLAHETALALAVRLETEAVKFPGGHVGFVSDAAEFAERLHAVLGR